jgi:hypothetical protein
MITAIDQSWRYLGPPKTASTLLHHVLQEPPLGGVSSRYQHDMEFLASARIIVSVRNPFMRAVSLWKHHCNDLCKAMGIARGLETEYPFAAFLADVRRNVLSDFETFTLCRWLKHVPYADELIHCETVDADLCRAFPSLPPDLTLPVVNASRRLRRARPPYEDEERVRIVVDWMGDDFERFGYPLSPPENLRQLPPEPTSARSTGGSSLAGSAIHKTWRKWASDSYRSRRRSS